MYSLQKNISLKRFNTFGIGVRAKRLVIAENTHDLDLIFNDLNPEKVLILGGGSNILFTGDVEDMVLKPSIKGIKEIGRDNQNICIRVGAGEVWDGFVAYCVNNDYGGIENLSLIPGSAGAAPMQNIGAYGVEVKEYIEEVEFYHLEKRSYETLKGEECEFGYRSSIFKTKLKGKIVITSVHFSFPVKHEFNLHYSSVKELVDKTGPASLKSIRNAIINIRNSKLPDPSMFGNAGSFFKNPVIEHDMLERIQATFPEIPVYPAPGNLYKIPAAFLIEKAGWKGKREGNVGCYKNQSLILVNYGNATGNEILEFAKKIKTDVENQFGIKLSYEVNIF